jgi:hypothetical protein
MLQLPGVIVRVINDTGIVAPPAYERYPVIIGSGDPFKLLLTQPIVRGSGVADNLPTIMNVNQIIGTYRSGNFNYEHALWTSNYSLVGDTIDWTGTTPNVDAPDLAETYYVTYTESRAASAYEPTLYFDGNLIYEDHGSGTRLDTPGTINDVTAGAILALGAGARGVIVLQLDYSLAVDPYNPTVSEEQNAYLAAIEKLETITDFKLFLVPMSTRMLSSTTASNLLFSHACIASLPENKQERTVIASAPSGTSYTDAATYAQAYAHERMVMPFPYAGQSQVIGVEGLSTAIQATIYDSRFYSAAVAGRLCAADIGINISDEIIAGVNTTGNYKPAVLTYLVQRGVGPSKTRGGVTRNVYIGTTDTTNALTEDLGVQDTKDYVKKYWREGLWPLFRNKPITGTLLSSIRSASIGILDSLKTRQIVDDYANVTVRQDSMEPRKVYITGKIKPAFSLQFIDVTFTFVLSF